MDNCRAFLFSCIQVSITASDPATAQPSAPTLIGDQPGSACTPATSVGHQPAPSADQLVGTQPANLADQLVGAQPASASLEPVPPLGPLPETSPVAPSESMTSWVTNVDVPLWDSWAQPQEQAAAQFTVSQVVVHQCISLVVSGSGFLFRSGLCLNM